LVETGWCQAPHIQVTYTSVAAACEAWVKKHLFRGQTHENPLVVGFDIEWKPNFVKGSKFINTTALLQLAVCDASAADANSGDAAGAEEACSAILLHVAHMPRGSLESCRLLKQVYTIRYSQ
jgi:hypothetical protein